MSALASSQSIIRPISNADHEFLGFHISFAAAYAPENNRTHISYLADIICYELFVESIGREDLFHNRENVLCTGVAEFNVIIEATKTVINLRYS